VQVEEDDKTIKQGCVFDGGKVISEPQLIMADRVWNGTFLHPHTHQIATIFERLISIVSLEIQNQKAGSVYN
jgi:hypothetical protein